MSGVYSDTKIKINSELDDMLVDESERIQSDEIPMGESSLKLGDNVSMSP